MGKFSSNKVNKFTKFYLELIQLIVMALLFLFVLNRELVIFVKEFINTLPVGSSFIESIAIRGYFYFNLISSSPSIVAFAFLIIQVMLLAYSIVRYLYFICKPLVYIKEDIAVCYKRIENKFYRNYRTRYLENSSLLL